MGMFNWKILTQWLLEEFCVLPPSILFLFVGEKSWKRGKSALLIRHIQTIVSFSSIGGEKKGGISNSFVWNNRTVVLNRGAAAHTLGCREYCPGCRQFLILLIFWPFLASRGAAKCLHSWARVSRDKKGWNHCNRRGARNMKLVIANQYKTRVK